MRWIVYMIAAMAIAGCNRGDAPRERSAGEVVEIPPVVVERMTEEEWATVGLPDGLPDQDPLTAPVAAALAELPGPGN